MGKHNGVIYARQCEVRNISFKEVATFLETYHLQGGKVKTKFNLGLFNNNELISVMTFQSKRFAMNQTKEENAVELVRFVNKDNLNIIGGFSKLCKFALRQFNFKKIYSWADLRWVHPVHNVYSKNGFKIHSESKLGYFYTDLQYRYHRFGKMKPKNFQGTELEWNEQNKFYVIYDAGTINYVLETN